MTSSLILGFVGVDGAQPIEQALFAVVSALLLAILIGMFASWTWMISRLAGGQVLLPDPPFVRLPPATWGLGTILTVILLYFISINAAGAICASLGIRVGDETKIARKDQEVPRDAEPEQAVETEIESKPKLDDPIATTIPDALKPREGDHEKAPGTVANARHLLTLTAAMNVLFLAAFPWIFRRVSGSGLDALGLTGRRWWDQIVVGVAMGLTMTPAVYAVMMLSVRIFAPESHPVETMLRDQFSTSTALLAVVSAVVLAPMVEETVLRGVLQGWLTRLLGRPSGLSTPAPTSEPEPVIPGEIDATPNPVCWPAVAVTSVIFAALHAAQWPAPIPLFLFSMILGAVYQRTGSLLTAIAAHALFNSCATLALLGQQLDAGLHPRNLVPAPALFLWDLTAWLAGILS